MLQRYLVAQRDDPDQFPAVSGAVLMCSSPPQGTDFTRYMVNAPVQSIKVRRISSSCNPWRAPLSTSSMAKLSRKLFNSASAHLYGAVAPITFFRTTSDKQQAMELMQMTWSFITKNYLTSLPALRELFFSPTTPDADVEKYQRLLNEQSTPLQVVDLTKMRVRACTRWCLQWSAAE